MTLQDLMFSVKDLCISIHEVLLIVVDLLGQLIEYNAHILELESIQLDIGDNMYVLINSLSESITEMDSHVIFLLDQFEKLGSYFTGLLSVVCFVLVLFVCYFIFKYRDKLSEKILGVFKK